MNSHRRHEGYLLIDNRFGPGVTAEFIRASGKDAPIVTEGQRFESATMTCAHCGVVVILNPDRTRPRHYCPKCDRYVCDNAGCGSECRSFDKLLDTMQEREFLKSQSGSILLTP